VDVRIVAATNRRVEELLHADDFRRDLLYRLSVINIELPPLRERREDIPLLVEHFLERINGKLRKQVIASPETIDWLTGFEWFGNVRELENAVERAVTLNISGKLMPDDFTQFTPIRLERASEVPAGARPAVPAEALSESVGATSGSGAFWMCEVPRTIEEVERDHILATLRYTKGNKLRAAELLGIGRYSLYRKAERLGIDLNQSNEH
jgi:DNA-binding NtrC family response regulator